MKIALQEGLLPGNNLNEKLDFAEALEIEGLEISGRGTTKRIKELEIALQNRNIKLVSLCGQTTFDFLDPDIDKRNHSIAEDDVVDKVLLKTVAIKRAIEPKEVADLAVYLCSEKAAAVTGACWAIDLGFTVS